VAEILKQSAPERFVPWSITAPHALGGHGIAAFFTEPLRPGGIYGTTYLNRDTFRSLVYGLFWRTKQFVIYYPPRALNNWWNYTIRRSPCRLFVVIRDLRDTMISLYFSLKNSHEARPSITVERRKKLNTLSQEEGLSYMIQAVLPVTAAIQKSWVSAQEALRLRYEDSLGNEYAFFQQIMDYCQISVSREYLHNIVRYNTFEAVSGRPRGQEDVHAHLRKGISGDWKNHFTDRIKREFKQRYGDVLIRTGYEAGLDW